MDLIPQIPRRPRACQRAARRVIFTAVTPRPLIRAIIQVVKPKIGERIYDGACGSAGFLCESFEYMTRDRKKLSTKDIRTLQEKTFYGKEKKTLAYIIGIMNMILHGIEAPSIVHTNTLTENISDIQEKDRFHVVLANPPFVMLLSWNAAALVMDHIKQG